MLNRRSLAIGSAAMLAGCGDSGVKIPGINVTIPPIGGSKPAWTFHSNTNGTTLQNTSSGFRFNFPMSPGYVNYCMYSLNKAISGEMVCTFQITGTDPVFNGILRDQTAAFPPPGIRLWFQRKGDDWSAAIGGGSYRWWSTDWRILADELGAVRGIQVPLTPDRWTNVRGRTGTQDPGGFAAALQNCGSVGMTFGGGNFAGHGVNLLNGSAVFDMRQFSPA